MTAYRTQIIKQFDSANRQRYHFLRRGFRPVAYVALTRESGVTLEVSNG